MTYMNLQWLAYVNLRFNPQHKYHFIEHVELYAELYGSAAGE